MRRLILLVAAMGCSRARILDTALTGRAARDSGEWVPDDTGEQPPPPDIVLNEVMADGSEAADWLELVSLEPVPVDLSGWLLSDDWESEEEGWALPPGTVLDAGARLVVVADDGQTSNTQLSASFKLAADGEVVTLVAPDAVVVDEVSYPPLEVDTAFARLPDGTGDWSVTEVPTKGSVNEVEE